MNERLKFEGRAAEKKRELFGVGLRIKGLRDSIREKLDPFAEIEDINAEVVSAEAFDLAGLWAKYRELQMSIAAIEKALGR